VIWYSGLVRGAIAFALCDSVPSDIEDDESVLEKDKNLNIISIAEFDKKYKQEVHLSTPGTLSSDLQEIFNLLKNNPSFSHIANNLSFQDKNWDPFNDK